MPVFPFCLPVLPRLLLVLLLTLLAGAAWPMAARAAPAAPTVGELNSLVETLQDPAQRQVLIGEIKTMIAVRAVNNPAPSAAPAPPREGASGALVTLLSNEAAQIGAAVAALASPAPLTNLAAWARQLAADPQMRLLWAEGAGMVLAVLGTALLAAQGTRSLLKKPLRRLCSMLSAGPSGCGCWVLAGRFCWAGCRCWSCWPLATPCWRPSRPPAASLSLRVTWCWPC